MAKPKHKVLFTRYDGIFVKVYQEALRRDVYYVDVNFGRIALLMVVLIGAYLLWLT